MADPPPNTAPPRGGAVTHPPPRLGSIGGGADEVMLTIIAKLMGIAPEGKKH